MASKKMSETMAALHAAADSDDEKEAKRARKMLRAAYAEDDDGDGDESPKKEEASAAADEPKKEAVAAAAPSAEFPDKKEDKEEKKASAQASVAEPVAVELLREVTALRAKLAADEDRQARAAVFALRPDLSAQAIAALAGVPTASLSTVVDTIPKLAAIKPVAAVSPTRGLGQGDGGEVFLPAAEVSEIDRKMGLFQAKAEVRNVGKTLELGLLTPEAAAKRVAELNAAKGGA